MGLLLLRYGEIALKGQNRAFFCRKLRHNLRQCLRAGGLAGRVWQEGQRIYLETDEVEAAAQAVRRVFGIVSLSPVWAVPPVLEAMTERAMEIASQAGLDASRTFRVKARRADKSFPFKSPQIERHVGAAVQAATGARVDLSRSVDLEIGIEVHGDQALVFGEVIAGEGGMPVATQGRAVALVSSGIDSPVALWLMLKRGCAVTPVHFSTDQAQIDRVHALVQALSHYSYGWRLRPIVEPQAGLLEPLLPRLRELRAERWTCLVCKWMMLSRASEIAAELGAHAIITGDSLGQVASQTLPNLEAISQAIAKPILRPLIGLDKTEIMALARRIGTYEASTSQSSSCPFLPRNPATQVQAPAFLDLLHRLELLPKSDSHD